MWGLLTMSLGLGGCNSDVSSAGAGPQASDATNQQSPSAVSGDPEAIALSGRVIGVVDGDTIDILVDRHTVRIRLAEIDAPERGQPWGARSREMLDGLVADQIVDVVQTDEDRWGRVVGRVYLDGEDINLRMVELGAAWAFLRYQTDPNFSEVELDARRARQGLWRMPENETIAPWEWRAGARVRPAGRAEATDNRQGLLNASPTNGDGASGFQCGQRRYCSQMRSCEEARYHLTQCGVTTIDGDGDGNPCEQLCGG